MVTLPAEIDIANCGDVSRCLQEALEVGPAVLVADMTATVFCACAGVRALIGAQRAASAAGVSLRVAARARAVLRVLELTGARQLIDLYPSLDAALGGTDASCVDMGEPSSWGGPLP